MVLNRQMKWINHPQILAVPRNLASPVSEKILLRRGFEERMSASSMATYVYADTCRDFVFQEG